MPKLIKPKREEWGRWEDKSASLKYHPLNRERPNYIYKAVTNAVLSVQFSEEPSEWGEILHLWVRRHDRTPLTWREMQRCKDELVGAHRTGAEVFPPAEEVMDVAMIYHLWVLPEGFHLPFSLQVQAQSD